MCRGCVKYALVARTVAAQHKSQYKHEPIEAYVAAR